MKPSEHIEKLERHAENAMTNAAASHMDNDPGAARNLALRATMMDCTVAICAHLADLANAIRER